jgi:dTDP-glucose 4,6-dehydratase
MAKVLVTGGCGFIGSNFIHYLLETDPAAQVINLDALTYAGNLANLEAVASNQRYAFVHGSVTDRELVRGILREGVHSVLHFAAESHVDRSIHDATPFVSTNILGTQILLDAAREFGVQRYVQVSTD